MPLSLFPTSPFPSVTRSLRALDRGIYVVGPSHIAAAINPVILVAPSSAHAQSKDGELLTTKTTPRLEELGAQGSEALFNLDYDVARRRFTELNRLYPDDPKQQSHE